MANEELAQTLDRLHDQLARSPELDEPTMLRLRALLDEIQVVCTEPAADSNAVASDAVEDESQQSLNQQLKDMIEDFETRHPQLTVTLSQIADRLSDMGI